MHNVRNGFNVFRDPIHIIRSSSNVAGDPIHIIRSSSNVAGDPIQIVWHICLLTVGYCFKKEISYL